MLFDVNVSYGVWPFQRFPFQTLRQLADHLKAEGIEQAMVSHLGGVFYPDPDPFNRELFEEGQPLAGVIPVPVINPAFPGWERSLDAYRDLIEVKAVKIYPTFHNYGLNSDAMAPLAGYLADRKILLLLQIRMEDERMQYFALRIQGLPVDDVVTFHRRHPDLDVICLNTYLPEALRIGKETERVGIDTAFAEWQFTMERLLESLGVDRIFFGSHTPLLYTRASVMKLRQAPIDDATKQRIGRLNIECRTTRMPSDE